MHLAEQAFLWVIEILDNLVLEFYRSFPIMLVKVYTYTKSCPLQKKNRTTLLN